MRVNAVSISLLTALLLSLNGCGEKASGNKTEAAAPARTTKQMTPEEKFAEMKQRAEAGDAKAQFELGWMYSKGYGVTSDNTKAMEWLQKATAQIDWFQKAAAQGDARAQLFLAIIYSLGSGVPKDAVKGAEWLQKAATQGDADAQYGLGEMYAKGDGVPKDTAKAVEWYQKAATQGDADAQFSLGAMYANGKIVSRDTAKADEWLQKWAVQRGEQAYYDLGIYYAYGLSFPKDAIKAVEWFQKWANLKGASAQVVLGDMYASGSGAILKDAAKAVEWYQKAVAQGDAGGQDSLGTMYAKGEGVRKDAVKAVELFQKSAAQGNKFGQFDLAEMYAKGEGVPKDEAKAVEWFQKAAAQGYSYAQYSLGKCYATGEGVGKNIVLAYAWFNLAAAQQKYSTSAKEYRDILEASLTPAQRAEGQRLATNWKKGDILQTSSDNPAGSTSPSDGKPSKQLTGTAFAVSSEGHALTNQHVINGCTEVKIAGREGIAKVITSDSVNDLALLQLPGNTKDIASLNPDLGKLRQGEDIIVFGYPLNSLLSSGGNLTPGMISALTGLGNNTNQIQITAPIQPGSSGSPVMDKKGNIVGVVSMKLDDGKMAKATGSVGQNVNFAVNGQTVKAFLDANKVPYKTGGGLFSREKSNADIAGEASKWTVLVECWK